MLAKEEVFQKNETGTFQRVWIEQKINNIEDILNVQRKVSEKQSAFIPYELEKIHLTVFHFGIPTDLYKEFKVFQPELTLDEFLDRLGSMLMNFAELIPDSMESEILGLDLFGGRVNPKLGLVLERNKLMEEYRNKIIVGLVGFLHELGSANPEEFLQKSRNLRYSLNKKFVPHITLGFWHGGEEYKTIQPDIKKVNLYPSYFVNFNNNHPQIKN